MISIQSGSKRFFLLGCILLLLPLANAQELQEQVEVQLVQVDLLATDSKGVLVTDLSANDFVLKENGVVQNVTHFYNSAHDETRYPLAMSFLVDTSFSMHEKVAGMTRIEIAVEAADLVMNQLNPEDQVELIEFNNKPEAVVPFTSDLESVWQKLESLKFREANTAMHDAFVFALERIQDKTGRKIIVIFSDGMDSASKSVEQDVIDAIRRTDATIVSFYAEEAGRDFLAGPNPTSFKRVRVGAGEDLLRQYAEMSGGQFFSFRKEPELLKALEDLRAIVKSQYTLAYTPSEIKKRAGFRKIKVECKRKGIKLRHREGYWAS